MLELNPNAELLFNSLERGISKEITTSFELGGNDLSLDLELFPTRNRRPNGLDSDL